MIVPNFVNPSNNTLSKKRKLQTNGSCDQEDNTEGPGLYLSDIDVSRDLFDFYYVSNADQEKFKMSLSLELQSWDERGMKL